MVGGEAEYFCKPQNQEQLLEAVQFAQAKELLVTVFGWGSNILVSDRGIAGLVICLRQFTGVQTKIENKRIYIEALAGTAKSELLKIFLKNKLPPALFLAGLPGDIGGGVVMNAGVAEQFTPREFMDFVDQITVLKLDGEVKTYFKKDLQVSYRHTTGWQPGIVMSVQISWPMDVDESILQKVKDANRSRLSKLKT